MTATAAEREFDWEAAGLGLGQSLNLHHAIVVVGQDATQAGQVAVGIGRAQAAHRRVTIGDLFGDSPPIRSLVHDDDAHGLVEAMSYGITLSRITRAVPGAARLCVIPTGIEPPDYQDLLANPRWGRLSAEFRETASLLILAAPAAAPGIAELAASTDGIVLVGDAIPADVPASSVVATLREPRVAARLRPHPSRAAKVPRRAIKIATMPGIALLALITALVGWLAYRPLAGGPAHLGPRPDTVHHRAIPAPIAVQPANPTDADSASIDAPYMVANPGDSANAAAFAVELVAANTQSGAILKLQQDGNNVPAETFSPAQVQGATWYKVVGGAFARRPQADSLLRALRQRKLLDRSSGTVVRLPFAFLIDSGLPPSAVPGMISMWGFRGQPAYALQQPNGSAWLLVGAFESVGQSSLAVPSLRSAGIKPQLVYRKGRTF